MSWEGLKSFFILKKKNLQCVRLLLFVVVLVSNAITISRVLRLIIL